MLRNGAVMRYKIGSIIIIGCLALAGCNRSLGSIAPGQPERLPSAPVEPVQSGELPPPSDGLSDPSADPNMSNNGQMTAPSATGSQTQQQLEILASGEPVTRESVSGAWVVASDNPECRIILAFTKWSGGYRAATKRCNSTDVASVSAWDVQGQQVVLMDGSGATVARLYQSGSERYDGTTSSGEAISFSR